MSIVIYSVSAVLIVGYCALLGYYAYHWRSISTFLAEDKFVPATKLTVIIPARNEEGNIAACLNAIVTQNYPKHLLQVLVMNDHSTDSTVAIVKTFDQQNVQLINLEDHIISPVNSYKKAAIELAMQFATGDLIIGTDADCISPPKWLSTIAAYYEERKPAFIAMPVAFKDCDTAIEVFQELDFMSLQGITGAAIQSQSYGMCNGANMAYEKSAFYAINGFENIDQIASGDDMMLMHKIAKKFPERISFLKSEDVIVSTKAMPTVKKFLQQRIRWASKADKYDDSRIMVVLFALYFFHFWMLFLLVYGIAFFQSAALNILLVLVIVKTAAELIFLWPVAAFFKKQQSLFFFPLAQPFHILYTLVAGWLGKFGSYTWKGRKVK